MRSLGLLQALLVLFVLVPAAVLGWLGLKAVDGYEAQLRSAYAGEMTAFAEALRQGARSLVEQEAADTRTRLAAAADVLAERLPFQAPAEARAAALAHLRLTGAALTSTLWADAGLEVVDAAGRGIVPLELDPDAAPPSDDRARLVEDLRRRADLALFGRGDAVAASAVWTEARARTQDESLLATLDVEAAWLAARLLPPGVGAGETSDRLAAAHPEPRLAATGRTWVLLLLRAKDDARLARLERSGALEGIALTRDERAAVRARLEPGARAAPGRGEVFEAPLPRGARLRAWRADPMEGLLAILRRMHPELPRAAVDVHLGALLRPDAYGRARPGHAPNQVVEVGRPNGRPLVFAVVHRGLAGPDGVQAVVQRQRTWTTVTVGSLLLVVLLGLLLTRRAVVREREAVRLRDDFLANVSHELRTPLTSVSLHADLLARPDVAPERRAAYVEVVRAEGARLAALVDDLLDFAALERGARRLAPEPVSLHVAVERAVAPYRVLAEQRGVQLDVEAAPPAPRDVEALADPQALARILANLVGNAFKHGTPARDGGRALVRVRWGSAASDVWVEVRDSGPGVPAAERGGLFERFQRGRAAGARPGTGLGLALSRGLARALGGDVVHADDGHETVFRLRLPRFAGTMAGMGEARA